MKSSELALKFDLRYNRDNLVAGNFTDLLESDLARREGTMAMVSLQSSYDRVHRSMAQGEYDKAEGVCQHILQYYPQDLGTFQLLGQINLERKRPREARDYFRRVLEIDPENVSAHWGMGIAYQDEKHLEQAIAEFEQALEIKPDLSDLRSQLLRLYTEQYGASRAQLRLSRAGLGRLYVKGEMLDKAIEEFRQVLLVDPARTDVQLSLVEALWQAGQTEEATRVCEEVLDHLPNALKANLILGYFRVKAGRQKDGEELWRRAAAVDPNNTMARAIFEGASIRVPQDILPYDAATLPDFDEATWQAQPVAAAAVEVPEVVPVPPPVAAPSKPVAPSAEAAVPSRPTPPKEAPKPAAAADSVGVSWLDSLATREGEVGEQGGEAMIPDLLPFNLESFEDTGPGLEEVAAAPSSAKAPEEPFSLDLLGETAAEEEAQPVAGPSAAAGQQPGAFSLEDLGLSADEIAGLEEAVAAARQATPPMESPPEFQPPEEELAGVGAEDAGGEVAPFSLDDLTAGGDEGLLSGVEPFSMEAFGQEEAAAGADTGVKGVMGEELKPFSLEDLGLEEPAGGGLGLEGVPLDQAADGFGEDTAPGLPAFSWRETGSRREGPAFQQDLTPKKEASTSGPSIFEKMMAHKPETEGTGEPSEEEALAAASAEPGIEEGLEGLDGLDTFSLAGLGEEAPVKGTPTGPKGPAREPFEGLGMGLSFEEESAPAGESAEVMPFSLEELGLEEPGRAAAQPAESPVEPFSLADLGLEAPEKAAAPEIPGVEPFSLAEFGLEEPAQAAPELSEVEPFSLAELGLEEPKKAARGELPGVEPFSLAELGLEEPAAAAGAAAKEEPAAEEVQPFSLAELGLTGPGPVEEAVEEALLTEVSQPSDQEIKPFTLAELGLTPDEIAALGLSEGEAAGITAVPMDKVAEPVVEEVVAPVVAEGPVSVPPAAEVEPVVEAPVAVEPEVPVAAVPLEELRARVTSRPGDDGATLELARGCVRQGQWDEAATLYRGLIKTSQAGLDDEFVADLQAWIAQEQDPRRLHRLHRLLGDSYMKKGWYQQAINEYAWVLSKPK